MTHPALLAGGPALVTGGASGLGLATADRFAALGLDPWLADVDAPALETAAERLSAAHPGARVRATALDVSDPAAVGRWRDEVATEAGAPRVLMNNAGVGGGGSALDPLERWTRVLGVNLLGVLHGVNAFAAALMAEAPGPRLIVNTGSKQGITTPPGDTAYNVSKAGVKALTEGLAHTLRNLPGCYATAHLFVPGFVWTGLTRRGETAKPPGAWTPEQTVDHLLARLDARDFYIVCPDGETTPEMDRRRIAWAAGDVVENRPALSRWSPEWSERFATHMAAPEVRDE